MKKTIVELEAAVLSAQQAQEQAKIDVAKLEKDMNDFKHNKEGKLNELKVCLLTPTFSLQLTKILAV